MGGEARPLIAVTGRRLPIGVVGRWLEPAVASPTYYSEGVQRAGGTAAVLLPESVAEVDANSLIEAFHGLVVTGGPDVDPSLYGAERASQTYETDRFSDEFELALLRAAIAAEVPVLAICKGQQLLNIAYGGTLDQHISERPGVGSHGIPNGGGGAAVKMTIVADSVLAEALDATTATGVCHHHQAVGVVGAGLRVVARAADGVVEGLEIIDGSGWLVSVQWHPEDSAARDPQQQRLFDALVVAARSRVTGLTR